MLWLGIDTATPAVAVAVCDDARALASSASVDPRRHGELLAPAIQAALRDASVTLQDIRAIAVGVGPGPYTSLRVGIVTARTLGAALGVPVHGVCTLDAIADDAIGLDPLLADDEFVVATDARRREVYWARYQGRTRVAGPGVARAADLGWAGPTAGYGADLYPDDLPDRREPGHVSGRAIIAVARAGDAQAPDPLYLRRPDAAEPAAPKRVLA